MTRITLLKPAAILPLQQAAPLAAHILPARLESRLHPPAVAQPTGATLHVSGTGAQILPAGSDTTGTGTAALPYASLTKALSMVASSGNALILVDGTCAENNSGRLILAGNFQQPVVIKPYPGATAVVTNTSGTNGVVSVRGARAHNIQFSGVTLLSATEGNPTIWINPSNESSVGSALLFHDCEIVCRSHSTALVAVRIEGNHPLSGLSLVGCRFRRAAGASQAVNPQVIATREITAKVHSRIGLWDCVTTDAQWSAFSSRMCGISQLTVVRNRIATSQDHAFLVGTDSTATGVAPTTDVLVYGNDFRAHGGNAHGLEVGENASALVAANRVTSTLQGIVVKGAEGAKILRNSLRLTPAAANGTGLYVKGGTNTLFEGNGVVVEDTGLACVALREGADGSVTSAGTKVRDCHFEVHGTAARVVDWRGTGHSAGGAEVARNSYVVRGAELGQVRGTTVTTLAEMQAAWAGGLTGDLATNDSDSIVETF